MTPAFETLQKHLKQLPGLGFRSSERIALHLLVEKPARLAELVRALEEAAKAVRRCTRCGNLAEEEFCAICADERRNTGVICVVEHVPDLVAIERSGA
ncbi:MAG: recombination protein RecR, partial [Verrucomicrobia bacterium]|nr:recombination protein RecR [Verrucomicrobiota bacterium]